MKSNLLAFFLAALAAASASAPTQSQQLPSAAPPKQTAEQQAMMDAFQKAGTVGPNHKLLQSFGGEWTYSMKAWMDPSSPPLESNGTTTYRSLMDGRFVQHEHKGTFMGMPYHGIGLFGYDNVTKQFQAHFFENTGQILMNGSYDATGKTFTFTGERADIAKPDTKVKVRETVRVLDANTHVLQWYETRGGKEAKAMEITYKRKR